MTQAIVHLRQRWAGTVVIALACSFGAGPDTARAVNETTRQVATPDHKARPAVERAP